MYCKNCGKEIDNDAAFCPYCGVAVNGYAVNDYNTNNYAPYGAPPKEYNLMAILGIIFAAIGFTSIVMGISGLVCSIIGYRHAVKTGTKKGKGLAVAGIVISIIAIIVQIIVIAVQIADGSGDIDGAVYY